MKGKYEVPALPYDYSALEPHLSGELLRLHHDKHHAAYVKGANAILEQLDRSAADKSDVDAKALFKELSFHLGGHVLHSLYWENMAPAGKGGGGAPSGDLARILQQEYGSIDRFKKIFTQAAVGVEGSGWVCLTLCAQTGRPLIMQVEKHNVNIYPMLKIVMAMDVWEHAYYLEYKNEKAKYFEAFWNIVNWEAVADRAGEGIEQIHYRGAA